METQKKNQNDKVSIERVIGIIFLIPPILGVIFFILNVFISRVGNIPELSNLGYEWTGNSGDNGGFMSAAPVYLGLMAIAGAMLLKDSKE